MSEFPPLRRTSDCGLNNCSRVSLQDTSNLCYLVHHRLQASDATRFPMPAEPSRITFLEAFPPGKPIVGILFDEADLILELPQQQCSDFLQSMRAARQTLGSSLGCLCLIGTFQIRQDAPVAHWSPSTGHRPLSAVSTQSTSASAK